MSTMGSFPAKLVVTMLAVYILLGYFPAGSALLHSAGGEKSIWWFPGCRGRSGKMVPGDKNGSGCGTRMITGEEATTWFQSLRKRLPPPPPKGNLLKGYSKPLTPPPPYPSLKNPPKRPKKIAPKPPKKNPPKLYVQRPEPPPAAPPPPPATPPPPSEF